MENTKAEFYESPEARVVEIKVQRIICTSGDPLNDYPGNAW